MTQVFMKLISELVPRSPCACAEWTSGLDHKLIYDTMKGESIIEPALRQCDKVCDRIGDFVRMEDETDRTFGCMDRCLHRRRDVDKTMSAIPYLYITTYHSNG